jgi:transcription termination/antitermination protein NusG
MPLLDSHFSHWFAVYVKHRHEKTTAFALRSKGYESFLPTYHKVRRRDGKKFELPLFPGYVFCRLEPSNTLLVVTTPGVFSIVGNGQRPEPIPDVDIEGIMRMVDSGLTLCPWPDVLKGQQVRMTSGPLRGIQGVVVDASDEKWLVISVHLLQRSVAAKVERESVRSTASRQLASYNPVLIGAQ